MTTVALLQDPANKGGTATAVQWYRSWMDSNGGPRDEYFLDDAGPRGWTALRSWRAPEAAVPRVLPRLHVPQYLIAGRRLGPICRAADEIHVVGASIPHGRLANGARPLLVWFATLLGDERRSSMHLRGPARRALYGMTMRPLSYLERQVLRSADRVLAMSPHTAHLIIEQSLACASSVAVVPVPVDTDHFRPPAIEGARRGVLFVGRARDPRKGFDRLLSVVERSAVVRAEGVTVISPGTAPVLPSCIEWLGRVENLAACYRSAALLVVPSRQEGLGIVAFEGLASGTPVVAYRCGGPEEFLKQSGGAEIVDDEEEFIKILESLLRDPIARTELGHAGRNWVVKNMSSRDFLAKRELFTLS